MMYVANIFVLNTKPFNLKILGIHLMGYNYRYEGCSIYNDNALVTPSTNTLEFYSIYLLKDQYIILKIVHSTLLNLSSLFSYRHLKKHTHKHCVTKLIKA